MFENTALSQDAKQIIIGGLLGDASLQQKGNSITFCQSIKQIDYLNWKYSFFNNTDTTDLRYYKRKEGWEGAAFNFRNANGKYTNLFRKLRKEIFDSDKKKRITKSYLNLLTPLGIAVWWMDDGCLSVHKGNRYGKLCTHCFSFAENQLIQKYFYDTWGIHMDIKIEKRKYFFLRLNVENLKKLISIIYPHIVSIPTMIYKIDLNYVNNVSLGDFKDVYYYIQNERNKIA